MFLIDKMPLYTCHLLGSIAIKNKIVVTFEVFYDTSRVFVPKDHFFLFQEPFEDGFPNGDDMSPAEEAAAKEAAESKGVVKFGWIKGVLVSHNKWQITDFLKLVGVFSHWTGQVLVILIVWPLILQFDLEQQKLLGRQVERLQVDKKPGQTEYLCS